MTRIALLALAACTALMSYADEALENKPANGYRGIWYEISGAYSGGMATYPQHQMPLAIYAPKVNKTFFVYGGEPASGKKNLQMMIGAFDHEKKMLANPTLVRDCNTKDAHANPCMAINAQGHIFIYTAGRHAHKGRIYRSLQPYDISEFEMVVEAGIPYPQSWIGSDGRHFLKFTRYKGSKRNIYTVTSEDGLKWQFNRRKAIAEQGHYVATYMHKDRLWMVLNWHPKGSDSRTNLYVIRSDDFGKTWQNIEGENLKMPLKFPENPGLIRDYAVEKKFIYLNDIIVDADGQPIILYVEASGGSKVTGPKGDPRRWMTARYDGSQWHYHSICQVDHNYDYGNIRINKDGVWRVVGPTEPGPHPYTTGGDIAIWESSDTGKTWQRVKTLTEQSERNHSYVRIPYNFHPDFYAYWADGDTTKHSESDLYFTDWDGNVFRMPRIIEGDWIKPILVAP